MTPDNSPARPGFNPESTKRYYEPLRDKDAVVAKFRGILSQPTIGNPIVFEAIADSFAVISGRNYPAAMEEWNEAYFEHPRLGEVDLGYFREDAGYDESAFVQLGEVAPSLNFYKQIGGEIKTTQITNADEEDVEIVPDERRAIVMALLDGVESVTPNNP